MPACALVRDPTCFLGVWGPTELPARAGPFVLKAGSLKHKLLTKAAFCESLAPSEMYDGHMFL